MKALSFWLFAALFLFQCSDSQNEKEQDKTELRSPEDRFGELFREVQMAGVFPDSKTFADCTPKMTDQEILDIYESNKSHPEFHLKAFVLQHFDLPPSYSSGFVSDANLSPQEHIRALWPYLTRNPDTTTDGRSTLIPLPHPYIVPGGRFGEIYYWDSYFTMLGLQVDNKTELIENMVENFAHLIGAVGHIPNGNRTYYQSRSQPPFFACMVGILAEVKGDEVFRKYRAALEQEYNFWMDGQDRLSANAPMYRRVVRLDDGSILNRYFDDIATPRPESYREDIETAEKSGRPQEQVWRDIRAAAESGWDFSSRWLRDGKTLTTIQTTEIIPVDLNSLLYHLEMTLSKSFELEGDTARSATFRDVAQKRAAALNSVCWDASQGRFADYDFVQKKQTGRPSLATVYPLFFGMASPEQAKKVANDIEKTFLQPGGVVTTPAYTGQQWDAPNGWAPLQWLTIRGLRNYGHVGLADEIEKRWVALNVRVYKTTGKMVEKYNVMDMSLEAGGGEYPVQDGFGWTNGVLLRLMNEQAKNE